MLNIDSHDTWQNFSNSMTEDDSRNRPLIRRREVIGLFSAAALVLCSPARGARQTGTAAETALADLERRSGGRLGVAIVDIQTGDMVGHQVDERFGMCSTFKLPLAAFILLDAQNGHLELDAAVRFGADDMVPYAPVVEQNVARGYMSILELAEAAQTKSDNVAANLLLDLVEGPAGFTSRLRTVGDNVTRLDRYEPELNFVPPGETRDTTTPAAFAGAIRRLLGGSLLSVKSIGTLRSWMENTSTGLARLRAGFPAGWSVGDKSGTGIAVGMPNKYNDVAVIWSGQGIPDFVVAAFYEADGEYDHTRGQDIEVLKKTGEIAAKEISLNDR